MGVSVPPHGPQCGVEGLAAAGEVDLKSSEYASSSIHDREGKTSHSDDGTLHD